MGFNIANLIETKTVGTDLVGGIDEYTRENGTKTYNFVFSKVNDENGAKVLDKHRVFIPVQFFVGETAEAFKKALLSAFADAPAIKEKLDAINAEKIAKQEALKAQKEKVDTLKARRLEREISSAKEEFEDINASYDLTNPTMLPKSITNRIEKIKALLKEHDKEAYKALFEPAVSAEA